jgi:hypothetical protein
VPDDGVDAGAEQVGGAVGAGGGLGRLPAVVEEQLAAELQRRGVQRIEDLDDRVAHGAGGLASVAAQLSNWMRQVVVGVRPSMVAGADSPEMRCMVTAGSFRRSGSFSQWIRSPTRSASGVESSSAAVSRLHQMAAMTASPSRLQLGGPSWPARAAVASAIFCACSSPATAARTLANLVASQAARDPAARRLVELPNSSWRRLHQRARAGEDLDLVLRSCAGRWRG